MIGFICSTPYQILLAINIKYKLHPDEEADIYILNHFSNSEELVEKLEKIRLFKNITHVDSKRLSKFYSKFKLLKIKDHIFYKTKVEKFFQFKSYGYNEIYFAYPDLIIEWAIEYLYNQNNHLKIHLYEDGLGAYDSYVLDIPLSKRIFYKITGYKKIINKYDDIMIFRPELYSSYTNNKINKIPEIDVHDIQLKSMINNVFGYKDDNKIIEKIVFLEQPMDEIKGLNEKIKDIADDILEEDYIIKLHPRSKLEDYKKHKIYKNKSVPWEVICLNNDIEDKVLVSYFSTAGISSKILLDKEPIVIFLFNLKELKNIYTISEDLEKFCYKFKNTYRNSKRVFIPNNIEELKNYLKVIDI